MNKPSLYLNMIVSETETVKMVKRSIDSIFKYVDGSYITITYKKEKPSKNSKLFKLLKNDYKANISFFK